MKTYVDQIIQLLQGKKFKDKLHGQGKETTVSGIPTTDLNLSDSDGGSTGKADQVPITWPKRPPEGAGDGFVNSIRGLFHSQRRKAKAFVLRTMRGEEENDQMGGGDWSESDTEYSPFARQLTITKARKLIRRHTKKFRAKKGLPRLSFCQSIVLTFQNGWVGRFKTGTFYTGPNWSGWANRSTLFFSLLN